MSPTTGPDPPAAPRRADRIAAIGGADHPGERAGRLARAITRHHNLGMPRWSRALRRAFLVLLTALVMLVVGCSDDEDFSDLTPENEGQGISSSA